VFPDAQVLVESLANAVCKQAEAVNRYERYKLTLACPGELFQAANNANASAFLIKPCDAASPAG
jgi:hypothetical protein